MIMLESKIEKDSIWAYKYFFQWACDYSSALAY